MREHNKYKQTYSKNTKPYVKLDCIINKDNIVLFFDDVNNKYRNPETVIKPAITITAEIDQK